MTKDSKIYFILVLLVSAFFGSVGQLLFKYSLSQTSDVSLALYLLIGILVYVLATVLYLYILSRAKLSWAYSFGGLSYVFATILAFYLLHEPVTDLRWVGVLMIAIGAALIGLS